MVTEGEEKTYYPGGELKTVANYEQGSKQGEFTEYYPDGVVRAKVAYENDKKNGQATTYYQSGKIESKCSYDEGSLEGAMEFYYESGQLWKEAHYNLDNIENDYKIRYASDVVALQESPSNLKTLFQQRTRWFRGTMEVAFKYGRLMTKLNRIKFDAETTLFGPFILIASLAPYFAAFWVFSSFWSLDVAWRLVVQFGMLTTSLTMLMCGLALIYVSKPRKVRSILWLPFVYCYWSLQAFIALYAMLLIVLRRPKKWTKTDKQGSLDPTIAINHGTT